MAPHIFTRRDLLIAGAGVVAAARTSGQVAVDRTSGTDSPIRIAGRAIEISLTPISAQTLRVSVASLDGERPQPIPHDGALVDRSWPAPDARVRSVASGTAAPVRCGAFTVRIASTPALQIDIEDAHDRVVQRLEIDRDTGALAFAMDSPIYGLGEGGPQFDRRGSVDRMRSGQGGYQLRTHGGRVPIQWLLCPAGWAMFINHPHGAFDLTGAPGHVVAPDGSSPLPIDLFVVSSRDPATLMREYAALTGFPEMPPLWAFGYHQSHRTLASREEVLEEVRTFREKKLPCDTMIYLGTGFCPSGWNTDNGEFAFNTRVFPDPKAIVDRLHDDHFKVVLHVVLEGRTLTGTIGDRCTAPPLPSGRTPEGRWPDDRQVSCYWPVHKTVFDVGIDGWWPDQGDGLDGPSRLARNRMYWDGCRAWRPDERPFALHRNGYAGMQRYAAFLWSGDVYSTWETLRTHVPVAINAGLSGIPFWGTDIGGFVPTRELTGELYVRWFQFGAFCPLFRSHGRTWKLRLPWGWNTGDLGPNEIANYTGGAANPDPGELHNAAVEPICRKYLELRYRLLPYLYSAVHEAHTTSLPIVRALWLHHADDPAAIERGDEYLWGRDILVAPVVERGAASRRLYLPRGTWYDFWTANRVDGGREIAREVDLETMPLYVRAGSIVPLDPVRQYVGEPVAEPMTIRVYPGADAMFALYEDDGRSFAYQRGDRMTLQLRWSDRQRRLTLRLDDGSRMRQPIPRRFRLEIAGASSAREISFSGQQMEVTL